MANSKNWALITAIVIPVLMILMVIGSVYWPHQTTQPKTNFLYMMKAHIPPFDEKKQYEVQQGKLIQKNIDPVEKINIKLFIYDVVNNKTQEISFSDAQKLILYPNNVSPDGFEVVRGNKNDGVFSLFFGPSIDYNTYYLKNNHTGIKLNISPHFNNDTDYYMFNFLGWIKTQGTH